MNFGSNGIVMPQIIIANEWPQKKIHTTPLCRNDAHPLSNNAQNANEPVDSPCIQRKSIEKAGSYEVYHRDLPRQPARQLAV